ncbi:MAG: hypothetical protein RMJ66_07485 [Bacteroidia bacterium]|nr:hypothetical protein [Bacteroidia bacterium]MDW8134896.1 hypothetical protein [Bacteroidia bacterium]
MLPVPSHAVLESYAQELQRLWLTGKVHSAWSLSLLRENFLSEQVVRFIIFQADTRLFYALQEIGLWDWRDGQLIDWLGDFVSKAQERIAISHVQLSPLLYNAIYHTLSVIVTPQQALAQFYFGQRPALTVEEFRFYSRYVVYFEFIPAALLSYARRQGLPVIDKSMWQEKVPRILQLYKEETQEEIETYQKRLLESMTQQKWEQIEQHWKKLAEEREDIIGSVITEDSSTTDVLTKNLFGASAGEPASSQVNPRARNPLLSAIDYEPRRLISERFQPQSRRAETLKRFDLETLPIHKQFVFIQRIFDGDPMAFRQALDKLNEVTSEEDARRLVQTLVNPKSDPQAVVEFEKWVISRFQN